MVEQVEEVELELHLHRSVILKFFLKEVSTSLFPGPVQIPPPESRSTQHEAVHGVSIRIEPLPAVSATARQGWPAHARAAAACYRAPRITNTCMLLITA